MKITSFGRCLLESIFRLIVMKLRFKTSHFLGPVACKNRIRILLLGRDADIIVKTAAVEMEQDGNEIITGSVKQVFIFASSKAFLLSFL